jgi:hypothetical protein
MVQSANRLKRSPAFRTGLARRAVPFAIAALVGLAVGPLPPNGVALTPFLLAAGLTAMLLATVVFVPWDRWSPDVQIILPLAYLGVVALLREAGGGTQAGVAVLVLLPVMWVSLYGCSSCSPPVGPRWCCRCCCNAVIAINEVTLCGPPWWWSSGLRSA